MGTSSSHHQEPVDRASFGGSFKRSTSLRHSKSKGTVRSSQRKMDKIRSSFRESFRRKKDPVPELTKQQQWQIDSADVRTGNCCFHVKYLGCLEVFESRGMQVCEEALKVLRSSRRRPIKAILYVSGDGLRVVEDDSKGLIVDQTIEKVSFCAPDRNNERGFSYICRDGTTRRWLCHGFLAINESGERLSHAVGCAFALCLERKQTREKENVAGSVDSDNKRIAASSVSTSVASSLSTTAVSTGTITTPTGQAVVAAAAIPANIVAAYAKINNATKKENIPVKRTVPVTIHPIERPHATYSMLQRQGSFRGLSHLNQASPFKRQLSLKISDLPSNIERTTRLRNLVRSNESAIIPPFTGSTAANATVGNVDSTAIETNSISNVFIAKVDAVSLQNSSDVSVTGNVFSDSAMRRNFPLYSMNNRSMDDIRGSLKRSASFTPPPTPPPVSFVGELPRPEQWLGKVSEITSNISELTANITELDTRPVSTSVTAAEPSLSKSPTIPKSPNARRNQLLAYHGKAHSLGSAIDTTRYAIAVTSSSNVSSVPTATTAAAIVTEALPGNNDPFDAEWALGVTQQQPQQPQQAVKNTNPFLNSMTTTTIS